MVDQQVEANVMSGVSVQNLWENSPDALLLVEPGGIIRMTNSRASEMFRFGADGLTGTSVEELIPDAARDRHRAQRAAFEADPHPRPMGTGLRLHGLRSDGSVFPVHVSLSPIGADGMTLAAVRDMTDWVASEHHLRQVEWQRDRAEDHERIARELHDTVIQELFGAGIGLQALQATSSEPERIAEIVEVLDATSRTIRSVIFDLSSPVRSSSGLRSRANELVAEMSNTIGLEPRCHFTGPLDTGVPDNLVEQALAVIREGLTNVARHADADVVDLRIDAGDSLVVEVIDDGRGIPDDPPRLSGIANLQERAQKLGGSCVVYRNPVGGTVLDWSIPLSGAVTDD
jgi:two-component system, NarL family, sensor histidine kinase DevS